MTKFGLFSSKGATSWMGRRVMIFLGLTIVALVIYRYVILG